MKVAKILFIEDEKFVRASLLEFLRLSFPKVKVKAVETLAEAHRAWAEEKFDLLISDCVLPDGLACQFLEEIDFEGPVIILTGMVDTQKLDQAVQATKGPLHVLQKPVSLEKLAQILVSYLPCD